MLVADVQDAVFLVFYLNNKFKYNMNNEKLSKEINVSWLWTSGRGNEIVKMRWLESLKRGLV